MLIGSDSGALNSTLCALSSVAHLSISMTMLLSNRGARRPDTATGSGSDDTGQTPPPSNFVHSDDELRRAAVVSRRPPPKHRAAWRSVLYGLGGGGKPDVPSHIKSLPNLIYVDDVEQGLETGARRKLANVGGSRPPRRKAAASGSTSGRRRRDQPHGREGNSGTGSGSAANEGLVTSDESNMSSSSDDDDVGNHSTEELVLVHEDHPRRPPQRRHTPPKPGGAGNTLASPRISPEMSPINSTGVKIVIDRTGSDDTEPTVVLGSSTVSAESSCPPLEDQDSAATEAVAALRMPHSVSTGSGLTEACQSPTSVTPNSNRSAMRVSPYGLPNSNSQVFLLDDMA